MSALFGGTKIAHRRWFYNFLVLIKDGFLPVKRKIGLALVILLYCGAQSMPILALSDPQLTLFQENINYFNFDADQCSTDTNGASATASASTAGSGTPGTLNKDVGASEFTDAQGYMSDSLAGTYSYAELSPPDFKGVVTDQIATNLGKLPYKQKLAITYKGKTVVAEKLDIGLGGGPVGGKQRDIDLHFDKTVQALGVNDSSNWSDVVHVQTVADSTPLGPLSGSVPVASASADASAGQASGCCQGGDISASFGPGELPPSVPKPYNAIFTAAAHKANVSPAIVAAIFYGGEHGNSFPDPPPPYGHGVPWDSSSAGAQGPFQFLPSTWAQYGVDGNGDGKKDIQDLTDGAFGAANYLAASGAKLPNPDLQKAIFAYNHAQFYVNNVMAAYAKFGGAATTGSPSGSTSTAGSAPVDTSSGSSCAGSSSSNGAAFVANGYAWPVDIPKSDVNSGYPWPCPGNCHHDNTPAFDLSTNGAVKSNQDSTAVGKAEFAITDGTINNLHIYENISGCYSFQLMSSKDGYSYYYTHTRNPVVKDGQTVKAGDKVSEIGERKCTANGSYPHLHIDRGSPKGSAGGYVCCRDPGFVPIINGLYANLPK